jgi:hypothetical protein
VTFGVVYSAGSQIGRMAALLEVLLKAWKGKGGTEICRSVSCDRCV